MKQLQITIAWCCGWCCFALSGLFSPVSRGAEPPRIDYERDVRPILSARCSECHGAARQRGGLRLDGPAAVQHGSLSGPVIVAGKSAESPLIQHVTAELGAGRMPPKGDPLTPAQIVTLKTWIDQGAVLPAVALEAQPVSLSWSFQPLVQPEIPTVPAEWAHWVRTPIDAFILEKLLASGLQPAPEADRRILARRTALDLTGLPPTPGELATFLADTSPTAYETWIDRLLASPRYGERWARHWLDVAHYADSHGHDQDRVRPNAWPYRDYLIRAFNDDKPYARFVREQVAGDVLYPHDPQALVATGFLAAGPWDESGLRDINEKSLDRIIAQNLDRDDVVTSTMSTFVALTVGCARCHDHKFDPITQADYYGLQAVFAGVDKAERAYDPDPTIAQRRATLTANLAHVGQLTGKADPSLLTAERLAAVAAFEQSQATVRGRWIVPVPTAYHSQHGASLKALEDLSILSSGANPTRDSYTVMLNVSPTDLTGPLGAEATLADSPTALTGLRLEVLCDDSLPLRGPGREPNGNLHLSELRVTAHPRAKPELAVKVALRSAAADFDQAGWGVARALDGDPTTAWGIYPEVGKPHQAIFVFEKPVVLDSDTTLKIELDQLHGGHLIGRFRLAVITGSLAGEAARPLPLPIADLLAIADAQRSDLQRAELSRWVWQRQLELDVAALPPQAKVYCGTSQFLPDGSFRPSPTPRPVFVLKRGDVTKPAAEALPGAVAAVPGLPGQFTGDLNQEGARRAALADWLAHEANPLTWRVAVNRIWHYHFGRGIVATPNDFGEMGGSPSHPELLDWLAVAFRDGTQVDGTAAKQRGSLKQLHRWILLSSVYRQAVQQNATAAAKDADNRLLWRMNRGRLDAESVRDALLLACGKLDETRYGPPVKHYVDSAGVHVTSHVDYEIFDITSPAAHRRSIYRLIFRSRPDPFLEALDCPDASLAAPVRPQSVSAPQALALWNNKFTLYCAEQLANRAAATTPAMPEQVRFLCQQLLLRSPTETESARWTAYAEQYGTANLARLLQNSSEFLFID